MKDLFSVVEQKGENIRSYVKGFNKVKIEVLHCDESIAVVAFCKGLLPKSRLHHSLVKIQPNMMVEVLKQAQKYINLEEELEAEQLRKVAISYRRALDDLRKRDEAYKASQRKDQNRHNNSRNDVKDSLDPFKHFNLSVTLA